MNQAKGVRLQSQSRSPNHLIFCFQGMGLQSQAFYGHLLLPGAGRDAKHFNISILAFLL